jgi:hypothetical protein
MKNLMFVSNLPIYLVTANSPLTSYNCQANLLLKLLPFSNVQKLQKMVDVMDKTSIEIFQSKKAALEEGDEAVLKQVGRGKDIMMSLLCM